MEWDVPGQTKWGQRGPQHTWRPAARARQARFKVERACDWWPGPEPHPSHLFSIWERGTLLRMAPLQVFNGLPVACLVRARFAPRPSSDLAGILE